MIVIPAGIQAGNDFGCHAKARLVGVIEAKQGKKGGRKERNDRLIAIASMAKRHESIKQLRDLPTELLAEIEGFFKSCNFVKGRRFEVLRRQGPKAARKLVIKGIKAARKRKKQG